MKYRFIQSIISIPKVIALIAVIKFGVLQFRAARAASSSTPFNVSTDGVCLENPAVIANVHKGDVATGTAKLVSTGPHSGQGGLFLVVSVDYTSGPLLRDTIAQPQLDAGPQAFKYTFLGDGTFTACVGDATGNEIGTVVGTLVSGQAFAVNAGSDQRGTTSDEVALNGSVTDANPSGQLVITWAKVSGPGTVQFANEAAAQTTATFSLPGYYVLSLSAHDSQSSASSTVKVSIIDHYLVELKAWIPQATVVDPALISPFEFPNSSIADLGDPLKTCFAQAANNEVKGNTRVDSSGFIGDNHAAYGLFPSTNPDYRVLNSIQFDFDGTQISNFTTSPIFIPAGTSTRSVVIRSVKGNQTTCYQSATASPLSTQNQVDASSFTMSVKGSDPLTPSNATPSADGTITGHLEASGDISFNYTTDLFPSYGIAVQRNNQIWMENIINDASCVPTQGYLGAAQIAVRLITIGSPERNTGLATRSSGNVPCVKQYYPELVGTAEAFIKVIVNKSTEPSLLESVSHR